MLMSHVPTTVLMVDKPPEDPTKWRVVIESETQYNNRDYYIFRDEIVNLLTVFTKGQFDNIILESRYEKQPKQVTTFNQAVFGNSCVLSNNFQTIYTEKPIIKSSSRMSIEMGQAQAPPSAAEELPPPS